MLLGGPVNIWPGGVSVWTADSMTRVMRTQPPERAPGTPVTLHAARGEWEAFQVVVTGKPADIAGTVVAASPLNGPGGVELPAPVVLREHYVRVSQSTPLSPLPPGDYPDVLVPQDLPRQPLPASDQPVNQPFWIDVCVPEATPAGTYAGAVNIRLASGAERSLRYEVRVWNFSLPETPMMRTSFGLDWHRIAAAHGFGSPEPRPSGQLQALLGSYYDFLTAHRISVDHVWDTLPDPATLELDRHTAPQALKRHLMRRHASTVGVPIWSDWPFADPLGRDRREAQRYLANWISMADNLRCSHRVYATVNELNAPDSKEACDAVRQWGEFFDDTEIRYGIKLPFLVAAQPAPEKKTWGSLEGAVDIWAVPVEDIWEDLESPGARHEIDRKIKAGNEVWACLARRPVPDEWIEAHHQPNTLTESNPPVWAIDYPPINHRILAWLMPRSGITGLACAGGLLNTPDHDMWSDAGSNRQKDGSVINGDGSLVYPATRARHGQDMPVASIRLKWVRDSVDDYDYLMLAKMAGLEKEAEQATATFARGFGDWKNDTAALSNARKHIGDLLSASAAEPSPARTAQK